MKLTDFDKLLEILNNQVRSGIKTHDWEEAEPSIIQYDDGDKSIAISSSCVGFCFNSRGRFKYIYNWKDF